MKDVMPKKLQVVSWVAIGLVSGVLVSLGFHAVAQREAKLALPVEELRQFADVYGAIKSNYVEPVEDKKLITEANIKQFTVPPGTTCLIQVKKIIIFIPVIYLKYF